MSLKRGEDKQSDEDVLRHYEVNPWFIVKGNERERARIATIRYVLYRLDYAGKTEKLQPPSGEILRQHG